MKTFRSFSLFLTIYVILAASEDGIRADVGSAAGVRATELPGLISTSSQSASEGINRGLTGELITIFKRKIWQNDLASGQLTLLPRLPLDEDPTFSNLADFELDMIGSDRQGFFLAVASCYLDSGSTKSCIQFLDETGKATKTYYLDHNISVHTGTVAVSKDGSKFALITTATSRIYINVYSVDGERLRSQKMDIIDFQDLQIEWGYDDVLYISRADEGLARIYYWDIKDKQISGHYDFEYQGYVSEMVASPVDRRIAFELVNSASSVYIANLESGKAHRLVQADNSADGQFFAAPVWSPDGNWILVEHESNQELLSPYSLIAVPSDAVDLVYDINDQSATAVPFKIIDNSEDVLGNASQISWFRGDAVYWRSK